MPSSSADRNPVEQLAEEFTQRLRRGERPSLSEYVQRYPEHAADIRELFPALVAMEQFKPDSGDRTGAFHGQNAAMERHLERLGDYHILREIGRGGMGVVYEAEQVSLGRHVALKVLPPAALLNATFLERFHREARAAGRLHHSNIVPVFGVGHSDGVHYYAMQFIHGEGLDRVLHDLRRIRAADGYRAARPPDGSVASSLLTGCFAANATAEAGSASTAALSGSASLSASAAQAGYHGSVARLGLQAAEALAYAHRHGVLHRDIKPSNLLLDQQGTVWVTDFGLARAEGAEELTQTGDIVGTLRFMAPERFDGQSLPQSDVYALGVTLYELLTLKTAFDDANKARLIEKVLHEMPVPPRKIDPRIPRDLETVVLKCLAKVPAERYASAEAVAEDLRCFLAYRPIRARRTPWHERAGRWCRRNPWVAGLSAALLLVLIGTAVAGVVMSLRLSSALGQAREDSARARAAERDGKRKLFESYVSEANAVRSSGRQGQRFGALRRIRDALEVAREIGLSNKDRLRLRNIAVAALCMPDLEVGLEWSGGSDKPPPAEFDPDFRRLEVVDRAMQRLLPSTQRVWGDTWFSPDGRFVVAYGGRGEFGGAQVWRIDGPKAVLVAKDPKGPNWISTTFSPDSRRAAIGHEDGSVDVYDTTTGRRQHLEAGPGTAQWVAFHPHLPRLAVANGPEVAVWDLPTGKRLCRLQHSQRVSSVAWHPRGRRLATGCWISAEIHLWDVDSGRELTAPWLGHRHGDGPWMTFSHAGDRVVSNDWDNVIRLWDAATGRLLLSTPEMCVRRFSADDRWLGVEGVGNGNYRAMRLAGGQEMRTLHRATPTGREQFRGYCLHPGGRLLAASTKSGVGFFDLISNEEVGFVPGSFSGQMQFDQTGALWTTGLAGLLRWPVQVSTESVQRYRIGPPEWVANRHRSTFALSADGRVAALPLRTEETLVIHRGPPQRILRLGPQKDVRYVHVTPDGRWVITGSHHYYDAGGIRYKVWDAGSGRLAVNLPISEVVKVNGISPDSRWLYVSGKEDRRLEIASLASLNVEPKTSAERHGQASDSDQKWRSERMRQGGAYSPDNTLAAFGQSDGSIQLVRTDKDDEEIVRLQAPEIGRLTPSFFSPDGALLLADGEETGTCYIFDLRRIREQLAELGLDWDVPPYRPAGKEETHPALVSPLRVETVGADAAANRQSMAAHEVRLAVAQLYFNPFDAEAHYRLGECLLEDGKFQPAYAHLTAALAFRPNLDAALLPRAQAASRLRRWEDAAEAASRCLEKWDFDKDARQVRALALMGQRRYPEAVDDLSRLLAREPGWARLYHWRGRCYEALGNRAGVKADREKVLKEGHNDLAVLNSEAWRLLTGPVDWRDPKCALEMSRVAVAKQPGNAVFLNTMGVAEYRNGLHKEAVVSLEKSLAVGKRESNGFDLFFLAMCHARLGDRAKARGCFDQAVRWLSKQQHLSPEQVEELKAIRAEAETVLQGK